MQNEEPLANRCLCLCDDDNDIEMALACLHAYIPHISSTSMQDSVRMHADKFTVTQDVSDNDDTKATERALSIVLDRVRTGM
jgi:hypothetical protein